MFCQTNKKAKGVSYCATNYLSLQMSMIPLFPSLRPSVSSSICFDVDQPCDDESELREMEKEYDIWVIITSDRAKCKTLTLTHFFKQNS